MYAIASSSLPLKLTKSCISCYVYYFDLQRDTFSDFIRRNYSDMHFSFFCNVALTSGLIYSQPLFCRSLITRFG